MENKHTEYKLRFSHSIIRDICAFLNTDGGQIYIGLNDNGEIIGVENAEFIIKRLEKLLDKNSILFLNHITFSVKKTANNIEYIIIDIKKKGSEDAGFVSILNEREHKRDYYFRVNDKSIKTDEEHVTYWEIVGMYGLPVFKDYEPSDKIRKSEFQELKKQNNVIFKSVNQVPNGNLYKYMDLESALLSLDKRSASGENPEKTPNLRFVNLHLGMTNMKEDFTMPYLMEMEQMQKRLHFYMLVVLAPRKRMRLRGFYIHIIEQA